MPDVILVTKDAAKKGSNTFDSILSYCELKSTGNPKQYTQRQLKKAHKQILDLASRVLSIQKGRRFFVALSLCNSDLTVALLIRGRTLFSNTVNIDETPLTFLNILLTITYGSPVWTGFDSRFNRDQDTITINDEVLTIVRTLFRSLGLRGRGTVVYLCEAPLPEGKGVRRYALKESWVAEDWTNDVMIHSLMKTVPITPLKDEEEERIFGATDQYGVFKNCMPVLDEEAEWNYERKLPGLPIVKHAEIPQLDNPLYGELHQDGRYKERVVEDRTVHILDRVGGPSIIYAEPRIHQSVLFYTIGVPIHMFSCRRELLNALMGIVSGKP